MASTADATQCDEFPGSARCLSAAGRRQPCRRHILQSESDLERALEAFRQDCRKEQAGSAVLPSKQIAALRAPEAHGANQSPPLKPAQPKNTEQATRDRRGLRNRAIYLDVIELELEIDTIGLPTGEQQSQDELADADSRSGRDRDIYS